MRCARFILGVTVLALVGIGLLVLASAGEGRGVALYHDSAYFIKHQCVWLGVALFAGMCAALFDYRKWRAHPALTVALFAVVCVLLAAALGFRAVNGSHRWLIMGPIRLQPSEFAKIAVILALGVWFDRAGWRVELFWRGAMPAALILGVPTVLTILEPDFGSTLVIAATGFAVFVVGGMRFLHMLLLGLAGAGGAFALLLTNANRMKRLMAFFDQEETAGGSVHQLNQSLVAIQKGGLTGVGFNQSIQKQFYLPEAHTDFIFAIGAEELGLIFSVLVLIGFFTFFVCGTVIAYKAKDRLGRLIAVGATFLIFFQVIFNIGVVTGCLPTKGLALPFISYGGTNLMTAMIAVGLLVNVSRASTPRPEGLSSRRLTDR